RLERSAAGLGLTKVPSRDELTYAIQSVVERSDLETGRIRITVTSGPGPLGSGRMNGAVGVIVALGPLGDTSDEAPVAVVPSPRNESGALAGLKTTSYAENALALAYAHERGA